MIKQAKIIYFLIVVVSLILYPFESDAFSYKGNILGINFSGGEIFNNATLLYPGASVCKDVSFSNFSNQSQPLAFSAQGFNRNLKTSNFFNYFDFTIKNTTNTYFNKIATAISADNNNPEFIANLDANSTQSFTFCVAVSSLMGNEFQGFNSGAVDFVFGVPGEENLPPIPTFPQSSGAGATINVSNFAPNQLAAVPGAPKTTEKIQKQGVVAGETNNQNMCCNWVWWNLLPWILVAILLFWLIWMWSRQKNVRQ